MEAGKADTVGVLEARGIGGADTRFGATSGIGVTGVGVSGIIGTSWEVDGADRAVGVLEVARGIGGADTRIGATSGIGVTGVGVSGIMTASWDSADTGAVIDPRRIPDGGRDGGIRYGISGEGWRPCQTAGGSEAVAMRPTTSSTRAVIRTST